MTAILLAFAAAAFLGAGVVITQFGLRSVHPLSGAAISIPAFTLVFLLLSPILLRGDAIVWQAVPIFAAVGLVFPAMLTLLTFASNRALGPVAAAALGNLSPLFSVAIAVAVLHEPLRPLQFAGLVISVLGALIITVTRTADMRDWRTWALLLPLAASLLARHRSAGDQDRARSLAESDRGRPDRLHFLDRSPCSPSSASAPANSITQAPLSGRLWFAVNGICNGIGTLLLYAALGAGPVTIVAPIYATYPLVTVALSALVLVHVRITMKLVLGTALAVGGVVLILAG